MKELIKQNGRYPVTAFPLINAVLENSQDGYIFQDEKSDNSLFVIHKAAFSWMSWLHVSYSEIIDFFVATQKIPHYFHIYDAHPDIVEACKAQSQKVNIKIRRRIQLKFLEEKLNLFDGCIPEAYKLRRVGIEDIPRLSVLNLSIENKFWRSAEDFCINGFGFCLFNEENQPVSICYTACVAGNTAEIDVYTLPEYQKKGFAKLVVRMFVEHCIEYGIIANWDCFEDNYGSIRTARYIGFTEIMSYNFLSIFKKNIS